MPEAISSTVLGTFLSGVTKEPGSIPAFVAVAHYHLQSSLQRGLERLCGTFCPPGVHLCGETHVWIKNGGSYSSPFWACIQSISPSEGCFVYTGECQWWPRSEGNRQDVAKPVEVAFIICAGGGHEHAKQRFIMAYFTKLWNTTQQGGLNLRDTTLPLFSPHSIGFVWRWVQISTG